MVKLTFLKGTSHRQEQKVRKCPTHLKRCLEGQVRGATWVKSVRNISITTCRGRSKAPAHQPEGWHRDHLSRHHRPTAVTKDTRDTWDFHLSPSKAPETVFTLKSLGLGVFRSVRFPGLDETEVVLV